MTLMIMVDHFFDYSFLGWSVVVVVSTLETVGDGGGGGSGDDGGCGGDGAHGWWLTSPLDIT